VSYRLTMSQREILEALVRLYEKYRRLIKSKEIAEVTGRDEGTVRNIILSLKSLGLVESKTGPSGGYMPTLKAYEVLRGTITQIPVKLKKDGRELDVTVIGIELLDIFNPEGGRALLRVYGDLGEISIGDVITVGPAPYTRMVIEGTVLHIDKASGQMAVAIKRIISIPRTPVAQVMSKGLFTLDANMTVTEALKELLSKGYHGAPVREGTKLIGMFTYRDGIKALIAGKPDAPIKEFTSKPLITVGEDEDILKAMEIMQKRGVGRLVVIDTAGEPVGMITRTDILRYIAGLQ